MPQVNSFVVQGWTAASLGLRLELELLLRRQGCQAEAKTVWPVLELALRSQGCQAVAQAWIQ